MANSDYGNNTKCHDRQLLPTEFGREQKIAGFCSLGAVCIVDFLNDSYHTKKSD